MSESEQQAIGFLGGGKMAEAIMGGLIGSGVASSADIRVCEINAERRKALVQTYGVAVSESPTGILGDAGIVFLAVKPQALDASIAGAESAFEGGPLVVSIAAGRTIAQIKGRLPDCRIVRVMPNLAAVVGESMSAFCGEDDLSDEDRQCVHRLLSAFGRVLEVPESQFHVVTAVSGSGPAFFAYLCDALARGGVAEGMDPTHAESLALQTMLGTARFLREQGCSPDELITAVSSPKGTTVAGMDVLREGDVRDALARTVAAAAGRSRELSQG